MIDNIFVYSIVVLIVLALGIWIVSLLAFLPYYVAALIMVCMIAAAAYSIGRKAGLWS